MERRGFLLGLGAVLAAPAIVKAENLMKIAKLRGDGVSLMSIAHPGGWYQGYDRLVLDDPMVDLNEASLERVMMEAYRFTEKFMINNLLNRGSGNEPGLIIRSRLYGGN